MVHLDALWYSDAVIVIRDHDAIPYHDAVTVQYHYALLLHHHIVLRSTLHPHCSTSLNVSGSRYTLSFNLTNCQ